jgi:Na+/H+ antiporter NhaD/arsenite permease-like protein
MNRQRMSAFAQEEWLLILSGVGLLLTSIIARRLPSYSLSDFEILYILFVLFIVTKGLQQHDVLGLMARKVERGRFIPVKLVLATFFFSMIVTNDVALMALVPLTILLNIPHKAWLVIAEALAANAGSALSPFGNPQNLYIYWHYDIAFSDFIAAIIPFSLVFLVLLVIGSMLIRAPGNPTTESQQSSPLTRSAWFYIAALLVVALTVLRVLPLYVGIVVIVYALIADRESLRIDYALLLTFAFFFGFTDNLQELLKSYLEHRRHVFLLAALLSQVLSNVPTALLLADFTDHWRSLLWGVSVGGFGSLVGSLANLIAYRIYVRAYRNEARSFTIRFHAVSYTAFFIGILLYFILLET